MAGIAVHCGMDFTIQICLADNDLFRSISEEKLRACFEEPDLVKRRDLLRESSSPSPVSSLSEVDIVVVTDGHEDEASWEELREELGW